jgi:hypothetical protein
MPAAGGGRGGGGRGGRGGGAGGGAFTASTGDYGVVLMLNGTVMKQKLHIENVGSVSGDNPFGGGEKH